MKDFAGLKKIVSALDEKGYDTTAQVSGWLLSGDPTYITAHNGARAVAGKMDRDEILREIVSSFFNGKEFKEG